MLCYYGKAKAETRKGLKKGVGFDVVGRGPLVKLVAVGEEERDRKWFQHVKLSTNQLRFLYTAFVYMQ